jgi:DNA polymerase-3 subunit alpha
LRNLTILDDAVAEIASNAGVDLVLEELPLDDADTYAMLSSGETLGVFQLDGSGMQSLLRQLKPDNFEDISAVQALYRPGPMGADSHTNYALRKNGLQPITPLHPELADALADILDGTYGLIVYQEQVMEIARKLAGYSLGEADLLRRAMGKKKKEILDKEFVPFSEGMRKNGFSDESITALWEVLVPFSAYAFNKAHSAAYGLVSYWTAYLKLHYPVEYMAALLTSVKRDKDKSAIYLAECRRMGITVLPPDVNSSAANFTAVGRDIRFGLTAVRNVGEQVVDAIVQMRAERGAYTSFQDFLDKVPLNVCNKRVIESLIKAGAFDSFGVPRRALHAIHEDALDAVTSLKRNQAIGQFDLFDGLGLGGDDGVGATFAVDVPEMDEWDRRTKLGFEKEMLGLYVSDHPLRGLERGLADAATHPIAALLGEDGLADRSKVTIAGLITGIQRRATKAGKVYGQVTIEDLDASIDVMFFPKAYEQVAATLAEQIIVAVRGRVTRREDRVEISADGMTVLDLAERESDEPVVLSFPHHRVTAGLLDELTAVLRQHKGSTEVHVRLVQPGKTTEVALGHQVRVTPSGALYGDLKAAFGPHCVAA